MPTLTAFLVLHNFFFVLDLIAGFTFYVVSYTRVTNSSLYSLRDGHYSGQVYTYQIMLQFHFFSSLESFLLENITLLPQFALPARASRSTVNVPSASPRSSRSLSAGLDPLFPGLQALPQLSLFSVFVECLF